MARWSIVQVPVLLACCVAAALAAEVGAAAVDATSDAAQDEHVRDKRRLPDPGFVIPATPMGFTKKQPEQDNRHAVPAPPQQSQAERKASGSPSYRSYGGRGSSSSSAVTSFSPESLHSKPQLRQKKAPPPPYPGASPSHPLGREEHVRALTSFLDQTRKLGVPDEQALKLLDKELAKAKRQQGGPAPGPAPGPRPVYHATPLKPYGSLINFNQTPYEKYQLKGMKPIKTSQSQKVSSRPQYAYQTITIPVSPSPSVPSYQQIESQSALQSLDHGSALQAAPIEQAVAGVASHENSETPVSLESLHSYSHPPPRAQALVQVQHIQPLLSIPSQPITSHPPAHTQEVHQPHPVYVYQQEEVNIPQPQAEVHVELPSPILTKQVESHHKPAQHGLYSDTQEQPEEYASQYRFGYRVRDEHAGNDFGHAETREGKMTKGEYFVSLPDGRLQRVKYWADPSGYHAHISYTNHAVHPVSQPQHEHQPQHQLQH